VVSLQETSPGGAAEIARRLNMSVVQAGTPETQIIYSPGVVQPSASGAIAVSDYKLGGAHYEPYAHFVPASGTGYKRPFYVVAVHFTVGGGALATQNQQTGTNARQLMAAMGGFTDPVIVAGDMTSNREPFHSQTAAQPTFVRSGFYDASAAQNKIGYQYSTFNGNKSQAPTSGGVGTRADYILIRGFEGTVTYQNVANYPGTGSDHNLIWSAFRIPQ
jgi:endonuclease/exonuclease/phosphatase (EEP) superfamily protein YafD